jgi:sulfoxide reductase heme-binding subunit YedZ
LAKLTGSPWLVHFRRMLGLYCFFYAVQHFLIYLVFDLSLDFSFLVDDIIMRPYITVGFSCFVILSSLAVTSPIGIRRRMKSAWQKLHRLVYLAGALVIVHFLWVTRVDDTEPLVYGAILAVLLGFRWMTRNNGFPARSPSPRKPRPRESGDLLN